MKRLVVWFGAVLSATVACSPTLDVTNAGVPSPSTGEAVVANEESAIAKMRYWMQEFRSEQSRYYEETGHYAEDVTVDGRVQRLGSPYETDYWVSESLHGYEVTVLYEPTGRACRLAVGRHAHPDDVGRIICNI